MDQGVQVRGPGCSTPWREFARHSASSPGRSVRGALAALLLLAANSGPRAHALDIVLTNDDGFESALTHALYQRLLAAGHRVLISASTQDQSGRGGYIEFLRPLGPVTQRSRGGCLQPGATSLPGVGSLDAAGAALAPGCAADPNVFWVDGTPAMSALHGIDVAAPLRFGHAPDLVISGPNYGVNTGAVVNASGTVNAALVAINRGVPAIAVSTAAPASYAPVLAGPARDAEVADIALRVAAALERARSRGHGKRAAPLPPGLGLNLNVPVFEAGHASALPWRYTDVGHATATLPYFVTDLCADAATRARIGAACAGDARSPLPGVAAALNGAALPAGLASIEDRDPRSEQNAVMAGAVTISVIDGAPVTSPANSRQLRRMLHGLAR
ncbi:MAG: 5'/3'-nucleotidase SurE [Steroidobacteraceae bacterium]